MSKKRKLWIVVLLILTAIIWVGINPPHFSPASSKALQSATNVVLYSLDPSFWGPKAIAKATGKEEIFHDHEVLGKVNLTGEKGLTAAHAILDAVSSDEKRWQFIISTERFKNCAFSPRHGLTVISNGQSYDYLMCYDCGDLVVYRDGKITDSVNAENGSPKILNQLLIDAKIKLPDQPKH
jgi:hypothetical protein